MILITKQYLMKIKTLLPQIQQQLLQLPQVKVEK